MILTAAACRRSIHSTVVTSNIYVKVEPKGFQHLDLFSHLLSAVKLATAAARDEPMMVLPMVAAYPVKYCTPSVLHLKGSKSQVRDSEAEHIEENLCAPSHRRRLPPYGPIFKGWKKPQPTLFPQFVHLSTVQPTAPGRRSTNVREGLLQGS